MNEFNNFKKVLRDSGPCCKHGYYSILYKGLHCARFNDYSNRVVELKTPGYTYRIKGRYYEFPECDCWSWATCATHE